MFHFVKHNMSVVRDVIACSQHCSFVGWRAFRVCVLRLRVIVLLKYAFRHVKYNFGIEMYAFCTKRYCLQASMLLSIDQVFFCDHQKHIFVLKKHIVSKTHVWLLRKTYVFLGKYLFVERQTNMKQNKQRVY